jgi:hypothetical protein
VPDTAFVLIVLAFALSLAIAVLRLSKWAAARRARRDDLMAVADAVNPQWHDYEIEALRALFLADQNPQPSRRKR